MTHAFGDLQPDIVERAALGDAARLWRKHERDFEPALRLAQQHHLAAALIAVANEARDVGSTFQAVESLELALNAAELALPLAAQWSPPGPRWGLSPRPARATASGAEPVRTQRSYKRTTC